MKILLTGASGQLGQELFPKLAELGETTPVDHSPGLPATVEMDLADLAAVKALLRRVQPDVIVNAAAYTAVDQAEGAGRVPFLLNAVLPGRLARWCQQHGRLLLHYSTDYVFDGRSQRPYREEDLPAPMNAYGATKLAGEWAIAASGCRHLILRTSWVYSTHGNNFVLTMLKLARERPELSIVRDQKGCPTWARNLASASVQLLSARLELAPGAGPRGIVHYCDADATTWYDFAELIFQQAVGLGLLHGLPQLNAIDSAKFPQRAQRPAYSVLDTGVIRERYGIEVPRLADSLRTCLQELVR